MKIIIVFLLLTAVSFLQLRVFIKKKLKKDAIVFSGLMVIAAYLSIGSMLNLYIPNPTNGIRYIFGPINQWVNQLLS